MGPTNDTDGPKLLGSAPTQDRLEAIISRYFGGLAKLVLHADGRLENANGIMPNYRWRTLRGRFRFERA